MNNIALHDIISKIIRIDIKHRKAIEEQANQFGIHRSQHRLLMYLSKNDKCTNQIKISKVLEISPAAVAVSLKKLENSGLIIRKEIENDNRANQIYLSDKGIDIVNKSKNAFENVDAKVFNGLTNDEILKLYDLLDKIESNLDERND